MEKYVINGGHPLKGEVEISGAKNAAVAIIPAALTVNGICRLENIPQISDVDMLLTILRHLGAKVRMINPSAVEIDCRQVSLRDSPYDLMRKIRASYYLIGAMLARFGKAKTTMPGGCNFGVRPIDQHIKGLTAIGADLDVRNGFVFADARGGRMSGGRVYLDKVSVGATMNIMIAAVLANGKTVIENAAREPHIVDLANFLNSMGADVRGAGTDTVRISAFHPKSALCFTLPPDRIASATLCCACAACGGDLWLKDCDSAHFSTVLYFLNQAGCDIMRKSDGLYLRSAGKLRAVGPVVTSPYPGFPTDAQPLLMAALLRAEGESLFRETIFENRYRQVPELLKLGARIRLEDREARVRGVRRLHAAALEATDLRGGAAMVLAGLCAEGETLVRDSGHIRRGYEDLNGCLQLLGADISYEGEKHGVFV